MHCVEIFFSIFLITFRLFLTFKRNDIFAMIFLSNFTCATWFSFTDRIMTSYISTFIPIGKETFIVILSGGSVWASSQYKPTD